MKELFIALCISVCLTSRVCAWNSPRASYSHIQLSRVRLQGQTDAAKVAINFADNEVLCLSEGGQRLEVMSNSASLKVDEKTEEDFISAVRAGVTEFSSYLLSSFQLLIKWQMIPARAASLVSICDEIDSVFQDIKSNNAHWSKSLNLLILRTRRTTMLADILRRSRQEYLDIAGFLSSRIPRDEFPNLQQIPLYQPEDRESSSNYYAASNTPLQHSSEEDLVADCTLPSKKFSESPLDKIFLTYFRLLVQREIGYVSEIPGILGLLDEGRYYKLRASSEQQQEMVRKVLKELMTPVLPPIYRLFMAGIIPKKASKWLEENLGIALPPGEEELKIGPLFYAPFLTSLVTPPLMNFLLGPCKVNLRKDGQLGGMLVEKCKFLQESNCKGLCLHQCKLPAQQFFSGSLGVDLAVEPNFETHECQWSWGELALAHQDDPHFPKGCVVGCSTRPFAKNMINC